MKKLAGGENMEKNAPRTVSSQASKNLESASTVPTLPSKYLVTADHD